MMKRAWSESGVVAKGAHFDASAGHTMLPRPVQQPHPPIWIGGNTDPALRRAARIGTSWHAAGATPEEVEAAMPKLREYAPTVRPNTSAYTQLFSPVAFSLTVTDSA